MLGWGSSRIFIVSKIVSKIVERIGKIGAKTVKTGKVVAKIVKREEIVSLINQRLIIFILSWYNIWSLEV